MKRLAHREGEAVDEDFVRDDVQLLLLVTRRVGATRHAVQIRNARLADGARNNLARQLDRLQQHREVASRLLELRLLRHDEPRQRDRVRVALDVTLLAHLSRWLVCAKRANSSHISRHFQRS